MIGRRGAARVALAGGSPVQPDLAVGPDPAAGPPPSPRDDVLAVDPGLRWLVDFGAAEAAGMAVRVPLTADDVRLGFDTLLVVGLRTAPDPAAEATALEALVAAHRSTHGMATVPAGTATNHTGDGAVPSPAAGVTSPAERARRLPPMPPDRVLAAALGIDAAAVGAVGRCRRPGRRRRGGDADAALAGHRRLLPRAALRRRPRPGGRPPPHRRPRPAGRAAAHRARRAPAVRGPARHVARPLATGPRTTEVPITWLRTLRERWRSLTPRVPRLDRRPTTTRPPSESEILAVLRAGPSSSGYAARLLHDHGVFGLPKLHGQRRAAHPGHPARQQPAGAPHRARRARPAAAADDRVRRRRRRAARRQRGGRARTPPLDDAELFAWLRKSPPLQIRDETGLDPRPRHLLYLLARHAVLLTYAAAAAELQRAGGDTSPAIDPAVVDVTEARTSTLGRRLEGPFPAGSKALEQLSAADHPAAARLDELRAALDHLATLPPPRLAALLTGTLDLFAYRLDAWLTSLATRRLAELRATKRRGAVVGGYGWLEDVRPRPAATAAPITPDEPAPLAVDPTSAGFVHAPSLNQAATAALLRSGYVGATPTTGAPATNAFAVDLSSRRVRLAEWILDGVRAGQELAALLGQRFERGLHDRGLDVHLPAFRRVAPFGDVAVAQAAADNARDEVARLRAAARTPTSRRPQQAVAAAEQAARRAGQRARRDPRPARHRQRQAHPPPDASAPRRSPRWRGSRTCSRSSPDDELLNDQLLEVSADLKGLDFQIKPLQEQVARLTKRKGELPPLIATAEQEARRRADRCSTT